MKNKFIERRRYPRIEKKLPLRVSVGHYDIATQTRNLSASGVYCSIDKDLPLMTKLSVMLILPEESKNKSTKVCCQGVVVRQEKDPSGKFNIAIFFNDISPQAKKKLCRYIDRHRSII